MVVEYAVQYTLPEFNREFVEKTLKYTAKKDVYTSDAEYLQEYIAYIRQQLESKIADQVSYAKTDALWTYPTDKAVCRNLPQSEIDFYYDSYLSGSSLHTASIPPTTGRTLPRCIPMRRISRSVHGAEVRRNMEGGAEAALRPACEEGHDHARHCREGEHGDCHR